MAWRGGFLQILGVHESHWVVSPSCQQQKVLWDFYGSAQKRFLAQKNPVIAASYMGKMIFPHAKTKVVGCASKLLCGCSWLLQSSLE